MRDILFRGKRIDNGEWVEGYLIQKGGEPLIARSPYCTGKLHETSWLEFCFGGFIEVIPETVGQYTGLTDKNGKKIFEGDIISGGYFCDFFVEYSGEDAEYWANFGDSIGSLHTYFDPKRATVIGNIYDNPELLEV